MKEGNQGLSFPVSLLPPIDRSSHQGVQIPLGSRAKVNSWNGTIVPACQSKLLERFVLGELSICTTLVLLTKKGIKTGKYSIIYIHRDNLIMLDDDNSDTWQTGVSWFVHEGGSRSAYTSYSNIATLCDLIQETRSLLWIPIKLYVNI